MSFLTTIGEKQFVKFKLTCKNCDYFRKLQNECKDLNIPFDCCFNKCYMCKGLKTCIDLKINNPICISFKKGR